MKFKNGIPLPMPEDLVPKLSVEAMRRMKEAFFSHIHSSSFKDLPTAEDRFTKLKDHAVQAKELMEGEEFLFHDGPMLTPEFQAELAEIDYNMRLRQLKKMQDEDDRTVDV